jgi:predicted transposase/invertase (TIGR01784 family)
MAMRTLTGFSKDEIVQYNYLQRQIAEMDYQSDKYAMEHAKEFGLKKGLQQGIKQGLQQGLQQGFEQGSQQTKIETALEMFGMGLSLEQIERATKLPLTVIQNLKTDTH